MSEVKFEVNDKVKAFGCEMIECDECGGDGFIIVDDYDEIMDDNVCPKCDGSGEIECDDECGHPFDENISTALLNWEKKYGKN